MPHPTVTKEILRKAILKESKWKGRLNSLQLQIWKIVWCGKSTQIRRSPTTSLVPDANTRLQVGKTSRQTN